MEWCRLHADMLNDPKVQRLPAASFKAWINALCLATQRDKGGEIGTLDDVSFAFRETNEAVSSAFHPLLEVGLIVTVDETFHVAKWSKRQFKSDTSTDRVRRHRNAKRNVTETPQRQSRAETETEGSDPSDQAAEPPPDARAWLFRDGLNWLIQTGKAEGQARALIGEMLKGRDPPVVRQAFEDAAKNNPINPHAYIKAILKDRTNVRSIEEAEPYSHAAYAERINELRRRQRAGSGV